MKNKIIIDRAQFETYIEFSTLRLTYYDLMYYSSVIGVNRMKKILKKMYLQKDYNRAKLLLTRQNVAAWRKSSAKPPVFTGK